MRGPYGGYVRHPQAGKGLGDLIPGAFAVPQNPFCPGNVPAFTPGNGVMSGTTPAVGVSSVPTSLPVSSAWLIGGGNGSGLSAITSSTIPGSPAQTNLPQATTQAVPSLPQTAMMQAGGSAGAFGSDRGGYGTGGYRWRDGDAYGRKDGTPDDSRLPVNPAALLQNLPRIALNQAVDLQPCVGLTAWVANNPVMAAAGLIGLWVVLGGGR